VRCVLHNHVHRVLLGAQSAPLKQGRGEIRPGQAKGKRTWKPRVEDRHTFYGAGSFAAKKTKHDAVGEGTCHRELPFWQTEERLCFCIASGSEIPYGGFWSGVHRQLRSALERRMVLVLKIPLFREMA
jgi:hypothetical protein